MNINEKKSFDVIVIGGGAAGMMAAITAASNGADTMILEHKDRVGKKILSTGNGKCNYTNELQGVTFYRGDDPAFIQITAIEYKSSVGYGGYLCICATGYGTVWF